MKLIQTIIILLLAARSAEAAQDLFQAGQQAEAYANANDLDKSAEIYSKINNLALPEWQKAIVLYDLGTAKLRLDQFETAHSFYYEIKKDVISSPWLLRDIELNLALSSLLAAKHSAAGLREGAIAESPDLLSQVETSIHHLKMADALNCLITRIEMAGDPSISCSPPSYIIEPLQQAYRLLGELKTRLLKELSAGEKNSMILLVDGLEGLSNKLKDQKDIKKFIPYFYFQAGTLQPLLDNLKKERETKEKFEEMIAQLEKGNINQTIELADALKKQLEARLGEHSLDSLILDYQLLLYTEPLFTPQLQSLLALQMKIKPDAKQKEAFDQSLIYLEKAITLNDQGKGASGRFYLAAALYLLQSSHAAESLDNPLIVLKNALLAENNALQLNHLYVITPENEKTPAIQQIITASQQRTLAIIPLFVDSVLKDEQKLYEKKVCQKTPWDQAIPLFDKGAREANKAYALIAITPPSAEAALDNQTAAIKYWKEVLNMMKNPPSSGQAPKQPEIQPKPIDQAPKNPEDTLQLLQEMQLQDQKEKWQMPKEFKSW